MPLPIRPSLSWSVPETKSVIVSAVLSERPESFPPDVIQVNISAPLFPVSVSAQPPPTNMSAAFPPINTSFP